MELHPLLAPGDLCLDVGAGTGRVTVGLAAIVGATGAVHAFEPRLGPRAVLRARVATRRHVRVVATAVGPVDDPWHAVRSLDGWCRSPRRVALVRIGGSVPAAFALAGADRLLARDRPVVLVDRPAEATTALWRAGYRAHEGRGKWSAAGTWVFTPRSLTALRLEA